MLKFLDGSDNGQHDVAKATRFFSEKKIEVKTMKAGDLTTVQICF
jgi:hypothetical protein